MAEIAVESRKRASHFPCHWWSTFKVDVCVQACNLGGSGDFTVTLKLWLDLLPHCQTRKLPHELVVKNAALGVELTPCLHAPGQTFH